MTYLLSFLVFCGIVAGILEEIKDLKNPYPRISKRKPGDPGWDDL